MDRQTLGALGFIAFAIAWAVLAVKMFPYPDEVKNDRKRSG